jgi:hypothetical protein
MIAARPLRRRSLPLGGKVQSTKGAVHLIAARPLRRRSLPLGGTVQSARGASC